MDNSADFLKELRNSYQNDEVTQMTSLRQYNTALLEQITELRKAELERSVLQKALGEQQTAFRQQKEDLARKLAALVDEKWSQDLRVQSLEGLRVKDAEEIQNLKNQVAEGQAKLEEFILKKEEEFEQSKEKYESLMVKLAEEKDYEITQLENQLLARTDEINKLIQQNNQNIQMFQTYETQMKAEIARLRGEGLDYAKALKEANRGLNEMQIAFKNQVDIMTTDNNKLRQLLNVRDIQDGQQSETLKLWQDQLRTFDQHLAQTKEGLKIERTNLLRIGAQLENEIRLAVGHPFKDYIEINEREITRLRSQITGISTISPLRPKLEERLAHLQLQTDAMRAGLQELNQRSDERLVTITSITRSASLTDLEGHLK